jgi:NTP pyrophosphatase (non-canonical NTP hydrolase)
MVFFMNKIDEILLITQEECAEVAQAISKCFRFGLDNIKPGKPKSNREHLEEELGDLVAMITLLEMNGVISQHNIEKAKLAKFEKLKQWSNIYEQT